ncbi:probable alanine aminotransferase, mitochondrial [Porites lutea]|uniref:probable alanine aminotransferase, mitochondrial n=1 Tax=Porites lutea TaxID=51062 RepID=UPI003CC67A12
MDEAHNQCNRPYLMDTHKDHFASLRASFKEVTLIKDSYKKKAKMTTEVLNSMENVKFNEVAGAMPRKCHQTKALEKTRIYMIPGHVFDMIGSGNNFYYRITILPSEETFAPMFERLRTFHQEFMAQFKDTN